MNTDSNEKKRASTSRRSTGSATDTEYREALWARQADMAHVLRKQARGHDCEDLAIDLTALLLDMQRRQDADGARGARRQQQAPRQERTKQERLSVKSDPLAARGKQKSEAEEERRKRTKAVKAASGNGRLEQTGQTHERKGALTKAKATWSSIVRLRRRPDHQKEGAAC